MSYVAVVCLHCFRLNSLSKQFLTLAIHPIYVSSYLSIINALHCIFISIIIYIYSYSISNTPILTIKGFSSVLVDFIDRN